MSESPTTYNQMDGEPGRWFDRFVIYRNMGANRSLLGAVHLAEKNREKQSSKVAGAWNDAADRWKWKERAAAYDAFLYEGQEARAAILRELEAQEIERIMTTGYAAIHERIKALDKMARVVEASFISQDGEVTYQWMSPEKLREWRGMLDDIAKELGQRIKQNNVTGAGHIVIETVWGGSINEDE